MQTCAKFNLRMRSEYKVYFYTLIYITSFKFFQYQWVFFNSEFGILFSFWITNDKVFLTIWVRSLNIYMCTCIPNYSSLELEYLLYCINETNCHRWNASYEYWNISTLNNGNIKIQKHLQKKKCIPLKIHAFYHSISLKLVTKKSNLSNKQLLNLTDSRFLK